MDRKFDQQKKVALKRLCEAKEKGGVDIDVIPLLDYMNSLADYYTTSSCSGRISLFCDLGSKMESDWLAKWHRKITSEEALEIFRKPPPEGEVWFTYEPAIFHIAARDLEAASRLLVVARNHGFKKVGVISLKQSRYIVEVCSSERIEAPVAEKGRFLVEEPYIEYLTRLANAYFEAGMKRTLGFMEGLKKSLA